MGGMRERESEWAVTGRDAVRTRYKRVHYATVGNGSGRSRTVRECPRCDREEKEVGDTAERKLRRIGSLNYPGERKLGVCALWYTAPRVFLLDISAATAAEAITHAKGPRIARVCTRTCREHMRREPATTVRIRALVFSLIANKPIFSIFKDTLVPRICYLSTTSLVPARPLFLPAWPACPCLHLEEVEQPASTNALIFSSLSVRTLPAAIHTTYDIANWVFSRNATGISRYLRLTECTGSGSIRS